jgi:hypothetical protein
VKSFTAAGWNEAKTIEETLCAILVSSTGRSAWPAAPYLHHERGRPAVYQQLGKRALPQNHHSPLMQIAICPGFQGSGQGTGRYNMTTQKQLLAFDFGASSGRAMLGRFDGDRIDLEEIHRFPNDPVQVGDTLYWDVLRLFHEIKQGLIKAKSCGRIDSIGIDTWGVDFGLLDKDGRILENPVHYRDTRTAGVMDEVFREPFPEKALYQRTGTQFHAFQYPVPALRA